MVNSRFDGQEALITLEPNRSATAAQTRWFVALVAGTTLLVALFWAFWGAWLVLPFAGLEIAVLIYVARRVLRATYRMQVIRVQADAVEVEEGEAFPVRHWRFMRPDVHVTVQEADRPLDVMQLRLDDGQQSLEVGAFLNQDDRLKARAALEAAGLVICRDRWWRS